MNWYSGKVREPLLDGEAVILAGQAFVVAPFNIRRMRITSHARAVLRAVGESKLVADSDESIGAITEIAAVALSANYPNITPAVLDEQEELRPDDLSAVLEALRKANAGGDEDAGEARAPLNGASSVQTTGIA